MDLYLLGYWNWLYRNQIEVGSKGHVPYENICPMHDCR